MAISADGNTAVVGGPGDFGSGGSGAVWVWTRSGGVWTQQGPKLVGLPAEAFQHQGESVAISADGNTILVGSDDDAWIWTRTGGVWTQSARFVIGESDPLSVALSADGNTAIVARPGVNAALVWTRNGAIWTRQDGDLVGSGVVGASLQSVSLSADGNTAIIGRGTDGIAGAAWVWTRSGGVWTQQGSKLVGSGAAVGTLQGQSVSLSADGNTAIVGGYEDNGRVAAWVWTRSGGVWTQQGAKLSGGPGPIFLGTLVALSGDGNKALVGGLPDDNEAGAVWVWTRRDGIWTQESGKLVGSGSVGDPFHAFSVAISADGNTAVVGGPGDSGIVGAAWVFVSAPTLAPTITTQPANQTVTAGATASFAAAASGSPAPTVQWQVSTNGASTFSNIGGATAATYSFVASAADNGKRYRAVFTNSAGSATTNAASLTVSGPPTMTLDRTSLAFAAVTTGTAFSAQTPAQTVRLNQTGAGTVTWTAASAVPWLVVSPASGTGPATLTISTQFASGVGGVTASQTGNINLALTGAANTVGPIGVTLTTRSSTAAASPPFGSFDTPAGDSTVLAGSIALTGWTLDNIGVKQVELWRDRQAGETTSPGNTTPGDPRNGKIFIANATFVEGARPDVEGLNPTIPSNSRAGWGYLMLTWGLFGQGNGTYTFYAFGVDQEGNTATIGTKTVMISNNAATKPFGSIDTPAIGGEASGPNFGWALTPKVNGVATCKIQPSGVQYSIDSGPLQPVVYGDARADIAGAFAGLSNTAAAGGHAIIDWTMLANGSHTIGWLVTDDCNRADGIGSRFFTVTGSTALTSGLAAGTVAASMVESVEPITVARGYGELPEIIRPSDAGSRTIEVRQGDRIEIRLPRGFESAYQRVNDGQQRALPTGATWDAASGTFYWQPAPGFLGRYRIVFTNGSERISLRIVVVP